MYRRLASIAFLMVMGSLGLSGCQAGSPDVAAEMGEFRLTHERVDQIVEQLDAEVAAQRAGPGAPGASGTPGAAPDAQGAAPDARPRGLPAETIGEVRATVVQLAVFNELARRYAADHELALPRQDYASAAAQSGLAADNAYLRLGVDADAYRELLLDKVEPVQPAEADLREAYQRVLASGQVGEPEYDQLKPALVERPELTKGLGLRAALAAAAQQYGVVVHPRYQPIEMPLGVVSAGQNGQNQIVLVAMPLGAVTGSPAVRDLVRT